MEVQMKKIFALLLFIVLVSFASAAWQNKGAVSFSFTQTAVNDNWTGGEKDAITYIGILGSDFINDMEKFNLTIKLQLQYGRSEMPHLTVPNRVMITEAADKIALNSTFMYKMKKFLNPLVIFTLDSQFTEIMDPSILTETLGIGLRFSEKEALTITTKLGFAMKHLLDAEDNGFSSADDADTTDKIETVKTETGIQVINELTAVLWRKISLKSDLKYFNNFSFDSAYLRWDNIFTLNVWKAIGVAFGIQWIFTQNTGIKTNVFPRDHELLETLAITINYSLF